MCRRTWNLPWIWCSESKIGNNRVMNISEETLAAIEEKLQQLAELDPAELPQPAAELAEILSTILDDVETS